MFSRDTENASSRNPAKLERNFHLKMSPQNDMVSVTMTKTANCATRGEADRFFFASGESPFFGDGIASRGDPQEPTSRVWRARTSSKGEGGKSFPRRKSIPRGPRDSGRYLDRGGSYEEGREPSGRRRDRARSLSFARA